MSRSRPNHKWYDYLFIPVGLILYIYGMTKKEFRDVFFIAAFAVFCFWMGMIFKSNEPQYKAHVKDEVVKVVEIK